MKKYIILAFSIVMLIHTQLFAQVNPNIINNTLGKFEGVWQWTDGTDTVRLCLKKEHVLLDPVNNFYIDLIVGFHLYKQGLITIESSYSYKDILPSGNHRTISVSNRDGNDVLEGNLIDLSKHKVQAIKLTLNNNHTVLTWESGPRPGVKINEIPGITLPRNMVLIKQ